MKDIVIIGAGGFGREVVWLIQDINKVNNEWNILGFVDDNQSLIGTEVSNHKVLGDTNWLKEQEVYAVSAIGNPIVKRNIMLKLESSKIKYPVLIHPSVIMSDKVRYGEGTIICAGNIITVDIVIGKHVIVNLDCTLGHDAYIEDYVTILPSVNISGFVRLEECVSVGTGTAIIQGVTVGKNTIIGAGATVVKDLPENCTAVGSPAKPIKFHQLLN